MKRKRSNKAGEGLTSEAQASQGLTSITEHVVGAGSVTEHLVRSLVDPVKRQKLQAICDAFARSNVPEYAQDARFGLDGPTIDILALLLDSTKAIPATS